MEEGGERCELESKEEMHARRWRETNGKEMFLRDGKTRFGQWDEMEMDAEELNGRTLGEEADDELNLFESIEAEKEEEGRRALERVILSILRVLVVDGKEKDVVGR